MELSLLLRFAPARPDACARAAALSLRAGATMSLRLGAGERIEVESGRLWVTREGDSDDYFVGAGGHHLVHRAARVVLECDSVVWARFRVGRA